MAPQEFSIVVLSCPTYRVEFVISHHCHCYTGFAHGAGNPNNFALLGAAIYKITNEDHLPFRMPENTLDFGIIKLV